MLEKPITTGAPHLESVGDVKEVGRQLRENHKGPVSAAYVVGNVQGKAQLTGVKVYAAVPQEHPDAQEFY